MTQEQAKAILRRLLAGYPSAALTDPKGYAADIVALLIEYPSWAGEAAMKAAKAKWDQWPPSYGQLRGMLESEVAVLRRARTYRSAPEIRPQPTPEERSRVAEKIKAFADQLAGRSQ